MSDNISLQRIVTDNLESLYERVAESISLKYGSGVGYRYINSSPSPWPSFIYHVAFDKFKPEILIPELAQLAIEKKIPPFWICSPELNLTEHNYLLSESGFKRIMKWPGMICDLGNVNYPETKNITFEQIADEDRLKDWFKTAETNLFPGKSFQPEYFRLGNQNGLRFYALYLNQTIIGTVLVNITGSVAGFYMVSVLKEYRNQGLAYSFICNIMKQLAEEKIQYAVLQANAESVNLYRKIGFNSIGDFDIYWKIGLF